MKMTDCLWVKYISPCFVLMVEKHSQNHCASKVMVQKHAVEKMLTQFIYDKVY